VDDPPGSHDPNKEHPMSNHLLSRLVIAGSVAAGGLAVAVVPAATAGAATTPVNTTVKCSGTSIANLQLQREDTGKLGIDFGVDMVRHKAGVQWAVTETDNGTTFVSTTAKTIRDGSFSITRLLTPAAGANTVVGTATNPLTGETCTVSGTV
jgi:hypothetical protein